MKFTLPEDYKGFFKIGKTNHIANDLEGVIELTEPIKLRDLLGCQLYDLFITDLDGNNLPVSQRFKDIFDPRNKDHNGHQHRSEGIKMMLLGFVYYDYTRESDFSNVISGNIKNEFSNSVFAGSIENGLMERYNRSIATYEEIQWFICDNIADYEEYNGKCKEYVTWIEE